tara:strand:- start:693 stop:884 length:192 start_codon:yes stop_codon:yes gene_type:complete
MNNRKNNAEIVCEFGHQVIDYKCELYYIDGWNYKDEVFKLIGAIYGNIKRRSFESINTHAKIL